MNGITIVAVVILLVVLLIIKSVYDAVNDRKKMMERLMDEWGRAKDIEYAPGKIDSIKKFYLKDYAETDVDDITWNDLDMDELFMMLNHTESAMGEEVLYSILRRPVTDKEEIRYRDRLISFFYENEADRMALQSRLAEIGRNRVFSFFEYFQNIDSVKRETNILHYIVDAVWLIGIGMVFVSVEAALMIIVMNILLAISTYYRRKLQIDSYYSIINYLLKMLYSADKIARLEIKGAGNELGMLRIAIRKLSGIRRNSGIVLNPNGGSIIDVLVDYVRMLTHIDLIKFNKMIRLINSNRDSIMEVHRIIGLLDTCIAAASFRKMQEDTGWCVPVLTDDKVLDAKDIYHPFLENPIYNSYKSDRCALITGSNASGKSTFLKTMAISAIMAQTVATVCASEYRASCYRVMTSMALNDNIFNNKSYFIVELQSLKRIVDCGNDTPVLCCIDEVLRGTNTIERIAASGRILRSLAKAGVLCFAATHDIELASILNEYYDNYHFRERIVDDNIEFDYILHNGSAVTRNAINLLQILGYDRDVVESAREDADYFEKQGVWRKI